MTDLSDFLAHHEDNASLKRLRHPLVVLFHIPYALVLTAVYFYIAERTIGQTVYFNVTIGLYLSSAAYHAWRPNWTLRFVDQTMISWFVVATHLPFTHHEPWALPFTLFFMVITAMNKWYEWEPHHTVGSIVFFALGSLSTALVIFVGFPAIDSHVMSTTGFLVFLAIVCFIGKLIIYQYSKLRLVPNIWESPESGHCVLALGVTIYTTVVVLNPV